MITTIAEHKVDLSLLPEKANVLDLGCRGFLFADELKRLGHIVCAVDIDLLHPITMNYYMAAIGGEDGECAVQKNKDPQATKMISGFGIKKYTIKSFSKFVNVDYWDLIKIDIEGAEYEVIMSLTEPPAKQLSIEFHLHTGIYGQKEMAEMLYKLKEIGYKAANHEFTSQHGCGYNYWSSLFILK